MGTAVFSALNFKLQKLGGGGVTFNTKHSKQQRKSTWLLASKEAVKQADFSPAVRLRDVVEQEIHITAATLWC